MRHVIVLLAALVAASCDGGTPPADAPSLPDEASAPVEAEPAAAGRSGLRPWTSSR